MVGSGMVGSGQVWRLRCGVLGSDALRLGKLRQVLAVVLRKVVFGSSILCLGRVWRFSSGWACQAKFR